MCVEQGVPEREAYPKPVEMHLGGKQAQGTQHSEMKEINKWEGVIPAPLQSVVKAGWIANYLNFHHLSTGGMHGCNFEYRLHVPLFSTIVFQIVAEQMVLIKVNQIRIHFF